MGTRSSEAKHSFVCGFPLVGQGQGERLNFPEQQGVTRGPLEKVEQNCPLQCRCGSAARGCLGSGQEGGACGIPGGQIEDPLPFPFVRADDKCRPPPPSTPV